MLFAGEGKKFNEFTFMPKSNVFRAEPYNQGEEIQKPQVNFE